MPTLDKRVPCGGGVGLLSHLVDLEDDALVIVGRVHLRAGTNGEAQGERRRGVARQERDQNT